MSVPGLRVYDEAADGPSMVLWLPVAVVEALTDVAASRPLPSVSLDDRFARELRAQLNAHRRRHRSGQRLVDVLGDTPDAAPHG